MYAVVQMHYNIDCNVSFQQKPSKLSTNSIVHHKALVKVMSVSVIRTTCLVKALGALHNSLVSENKTLEIVF